MSHKVLARIAIFMVIVFGAIVIFYPKMFSPESARPLEPVAPVTAPVGP